ncbi:hypothetical protein MJO29_008093 [Puccinia striiformis f. sp. tritici]|uniref:Rossman fold oxidoreductase n=1 Tax=Puccinia striiformis TaxID=27350 RepID=A0A2S4WL29_9BASI|nr:hypothetical protein Pst134EA_015759 [Puccinia striiformis f. sp. tritici]KAH9463674.1 hypothetical protein Pst134EA_015759 [Puccinia striiformis f. sp. tritici]KAI7952462.1 hypothetical protein MJO29_008093 [Puccinia striiformis f. sp. tritici]KAI9602545.1 hypothetical protein H4Q26_001835 [Puccinia striiformis f. sp. tritici PST-130]POW22490.1 hypothetical protein PSHT_01222 [Puccinia striiformis]
MMAKVAVIQGSSRGIGLALTQHLLKNTNLVVVATSRFPSETRRLILDNPHYKQFRPRLHNLEVDLQDEESISQAAGYVEHNFGQSLRLLINVSGVLLPEKSILKVSKGGMQKTFDINTFGHLLTYKHFVPLLPLKENCTEEVKAEDDPANGLIKPGVNVLASISARVGSIGDNRLGGWYSYRASKSAINQIIVTLQKELEARTSICPTITVALHPGTVAGTQLSQKFVPIDKAGVKEGIHDSITAANSLMNVISKLGLNNGGQFLDYKSDPIEW